MTNNLKNKILEIFRAYDVRGLFPVQINEGIAYIIGQAFAVSVNRGSKVAVGRDVRNSSILIERALVEGINSQGIDVLELEEVPSPLLYFTTRNLGLAGGAMVTASHLPPEWNGIKFCDSRGIVVSDGTGLESIRQAAFLPKKNLIQNGNVYFYKEAVIKYVKYVSKRINIGRKLSVVVDYGNSVTANVVPLILSELGLDFEEINSGLGIFQRTSELTVDSLDGLKRKVIDTGSDLGIAYDADGDRVGFVDNLGNVYPTGENIIPIFAADALEKIKGEIIIDVTCSSAISRFIKKRAGTPIIIKVGHSYCANEVMNRRALFGAQYSGHYSFPEMGCTDDAIFASIKMIEILSNSKQGLSQVVASLPVSYTSRMVEIEYPDSAKFVAVTEIASRAKKKGYRVDEIDGVKIHSKNDDDEWVLIRASNTSPIIRVNANGRSMESTDRLLSFGIKMVKEVIHNY